MVGKADISPLILIANLSGTLLFAYDCKVTVDSGWTWMQLEVWVDDQKVWNVAREQGYVSSLADYVTIALPARHGRIEWRVNSGAHVLANAPSHLVHCGEVAVSIREIRFLLLAPGETYRAKNAMAVMGFPAHAIVMGEQDVDMPPSAGQEAQAAWLKTSTIVARNPAYGVVTGPGMSIRRSSPQRRPSARSLLDVSISVYLLVQSYPVDSVAFKRQG